MKRIVILFTLIVSITVLNHQPSFAQKQGQLLLDSILMDLHTHKADDTIRVNLLNNIAYEYNTINPDIGIDYAVQGIMLSEKINFKKGLANCLRSAGVCYWAKSDFALALEYYFKSMKICEESGFKVATASAASNIGLVYLNKNDYSIALEYFFKSLNIYTELADKSGIAKNLQNIGNVFNRQAQYQKALEYYFKALEINEKLGLKNGIATNLGNIGKVYQLQKDYRKALNYVFKALKINKELNRKRGVMYNIGDIGETYFLIAVDSSSSKDHNNVMNNSRSIETQELTQLEINKILKKSIDYSLKAIQIGKEINANTELIDWYKNLSKAYIKLEYWKDAFYYENKSNHLKDSVFSIESQAKISSIELKQERELKDREIKIQKLELDRKQIIILFTIGALILISLLAFLIFTRFRIKKKSNRILEIKNMLISFQNTEISLKNDQLVELNETKDKYLSTLKTELAHAANYVKSLIPPPLNVGSIKTQWIYVPSLDVGGDSFGYHWIDETNFAFYLFDVSGHGLGAAMHSVSVLNSLKDQSLPNTDFYSPKDVFSKLNSIYQMTNHNDMFFTIWYGVFNIKTKLLTYSSAGHPAALHIYGANNHNSLILENPIIGCLHDFDFLESKIEIDNKSVIYIYSDGVFEILKPDRTFWEQGELDKYLLLNNHKLDGTGFMQLYQHAIDLHASKHLDDDFSILRIEFDL